MVPQEEPSNSCKIIHVKVIDGSPADIYEIRNVMAELKKKLPFRLEAIVSDDKIVLQDVDKLLKELYKLKKIIEQEKLIE